MTDIKAALKAEIEKMEAACDEIPFGLDEEDEQCLSVMRGALKELVQRDAQIAALTAENVALKDCIFKQSAAVENWNSWADEEDKIINEPLTPATDAAANALRAEGVEALKEHPAIKLCSMTHICDEVAAKLREGKA